MHISSFLMLTFITPYWRVHEWLTKTTDYNHVQFLIPWTSETNSALSARSWVYFFIHVTLHVCMVMVLIDIRILCTFRHGIHYNEKKRYTSICEIIIKFLLISLLSPAAFPRRDMNCYMLQIVYCNSIWVLFSEMFQKKFQSFTLSVFRFRCRFDRE